MVVVNEEEIVEIAADLFGGSHRSVQIELLSFGERREDSRQIIRLNLRGDVQFCSNALLLRCDGGQVRDAAVGRNVHYLPVISSIVSFFSSTFSF